jgi:hypothetical protein
MMETLLIVVLIAFVAGVALSGQRPMQDPQIIYIQREPQTNAGGGCLLPLVFVALVVFILLALPATP